jgi:hypothetical protein
VPNLINKKEMIGKGSLCKYGPKGNLGITSQHLILGDVYRGRMSIILYTRRMTLSELNSQVQKIALSIFIDTLQSLSIRDISTNESDVAFDAHFNQSMINQLIIK